MMPWQLARAQRPKRSTPRPLVELLHRIDIDDFCRWNVFPRDWHKAHYLEAPFRFPFLKNLVISLDAIEANHHSGYTQIIPVHWIRTGFGGTNRPRPMLSCTNCGRAVRRLYFKHGSLSCRRCCNATYASRTCDKYTRPVLQAQRLQAFLKLKTGMWKNTRYRLKARITDAVSQELNSKRLAHHSILRPQSNYSTRGAMHWR
jgi:hypothetical protein